MDSFCCYIDYIETINPNQSESIPRKLRFALWTPVEMIATYCHSSSCWHMQLLKHLKEFHGIPYSAAASHWAHDAVQQRNHEKAQKLNQVVIPGGSTSWQHKVCSTSCSAQKLHRSIARVLHLISKKNKSNVIQKWCANDTWWQSFWKLHVLSNYDASCLRLSQIQSIDSFQAEPGWSVFPGQAQPRDPCLEVSA